MKCDARTSGQSSRLESWHDSKGEGQRRCKPKKCDQTRDLLTLTTARKLFMQAVGLLALLLSSLCKMTSSEEAFSSLPPAGKVTSGLPVWTSLLSSQQRHLHLSVQRCFDLCASSSLILNFKLDSIQLYRSICRKGIGIIIVGNRR